MTVREAMEDLRKLEIFFDKNADGSVPVCLGVARAALNVLNPDLDLEEDGDEEEGEKECSSGSWLS